MVTLRTMLRRLALLALVALPACGSAVVEPGVIEGETDLPDECTWNVTAKGSRCPDGVTMAFCDSAEYWPDECALAEYCTNDGQCSTPDIKRGSGATVVLCCP